MKKLVLISVLAVALVLGAALYATAAPQTYVNGVPGTVTVNANVSSKLVLTIATPDGSGLSVDFGAVDPGISYPGQSVGLNVLSNKMYTLTAVKTDATPIGLSTTLAASTVTLVKSTAAGDNYTDTYTLNVPSNADPGPRTATMVYTATQN